jgi:hypothetical protein
MSKPLTTDEAKSKIYELAKRLREIEKEKDPLWPILRID